MFYMRKLTGRQQQNNINCDESERSVMANEIKEGNEQLTAARIYELHRAAETGLDLLFNFHKAQRIRRRRSNWQEFVSCFSVNEHN